MADLSNNSFIPKRGPVKRKRSSASKKVYLFTLVSYVLMFATLLAVGGVYLYGGYIDRQLEDEIAALNSEISSFSQADMQRVIEFDSRLQQADNRLENSVSLVSLFEAIEASTIDTVTINSLNLTREGDENYIVQANIGTDSFDSTIFQRDVYSRSQTVGTTTISDVVRITAAEQLDVDNGESQSAVSFIADLSVPLTAVPYMPIVTPAAPLTVTEPEAVEDESATSSRLEAESDAEADNQENI